MKCVAIITKDGPIWLENIMRSAGAVDPGHSFQQPQLGQRSFFVVAERKAIAVSSFGEVHITLVDGNVAKACLLERKCRRQPTHSAANHCYFGVVGQPSAFPLGMSRGHRRSGLLCAGLTGSDVAIVCASFNVGHANGGPVACSERETYRRRRRQPISQPRGGRCGPLMIMMMVMMMIMMRTRSLKDV